MRCWGCSLRPHTNHDIVELPRDDDTSAGTPLRSLRGKYTWRWQRFDIGLMGCFVSRGKARCVVLRKLSLVYTVITNQRFVAGVLE